MSARDVGVLVATLVGLATASVPVASAQTDEVPFMRIAGDDKDDDDGPLIPWDMGWDAGFGLAAGASQIGTKSFAQIGVDTSARFTIGRAALIGGYQTVSTHRSADDGTLLQGRSHRFSAALGVRVHDFGGRRGIIAGETIVALGTGRQFISWDQGTLTRRDMFLQVEQATVFRFHDGRRNVVRSPSELVFGVWVQLIASKTPAFAIAPVSATGGNSGETDIGFLAGYNIRFRN